MFRKACLPDIRYKDTKNGKSLDRIYKKVGQCKNLRGNICKNPIFA